MNKVKIIGAGLAGCEAAMQLANRGVNVELYEMKPKKRTPAHKTNFFAELVCSNSLKASRIDSAAGLLKEEMRRFGSVCLKSADSCSVAAGGALAVDRDIFAENITNEILKHPNIKVLEEVIEKIPEDSIVIIASGPLTDSLLAEDIKKYTESENLSFYDAAAPIVTADSINMEKAFTRGWTMELIRAAFPASANRYEANKGLFKLPSV